METKAKNEGHSFYLKRYGILTSLLLILNLFLRIKLLVKFYFHYNVK